MAGVFRVPLGNQTGGAARPPAAPRAHVPPVRRAPAPPQRQPQPQVKAAAPQRDCKTLAPHPQVAEARGKGETGGLAERDRRWSALHREMERAGYDALLFAGADYRGHKGSLRYLADYNLAHRYGYAVLFAGEAPVLVLPQNLSSGRRPHTGWVSDYRYPYNLGEGLVEVLGSRGKTPRVGVVGLGQVMKVEDYLALTQGLPGARIEDAQALFDRVRAIKSPAEQRAVRESAYILDRCFDRLLEIARPGLTERAIAAEMYQIAAALGGEDPLFLTMYVDSEPAGPVPTFGAPRERELRVNDVLTFSYELVGPAGYWVEFSRMITFAEPSEPVARIARAVGAGMEAARAALRPGTSMGDVQRELIAAVEAEGAKSSYWSGHGMGLDVLEEPWVGLDVVQDSGSAGAVTETADGLVLAVHPTLWEEESQVMGYMSDSYVVADGSCRALSRHPVQLYRV
ncbi:M24 family metallopeptidase [Actinocorallia sp. A-T 12471]|uniref:M24 family metallopeptidase n=1 Tax=Actinocorallia sp. A-T 12471 TaxID=3089813 RepID=UPI0029CDC3BF|nr:M24 family metallopeptidase [Actinocorallia sp. A-T 12471]MDX6742770.1 M24 family metallopeptidase [Actinocorallia sp. A-T 12471]